MPSTGAADEAVEHEGETVEASAAELETEDPDLESGEDVEAEDFATSVDPMLDADIGPGEAEGVLKKTSGTDSEGGGERRKESHDRYQQLRRN